MELIGAAGTVTGMGGLSSDAEELGKYSTYTRNSPGASHRFRGGEISLQITQKRNFAVGSCQVQVWDNSP